MVENGRFYQLPNRRQIGGRGMKLHGNGGDMLAKSSHLKGGIHGTQAVHVPCTKTVHLGYESGTHGTHTLRVCTSVPRTSSGKRYPWE